MMEPLIITGTDEIPTVILDKEKNLFEISGQSIPEEAISFYSPVIDWFEEYSQNPNSKTILNLQLEYCNSSSSKAIVDILEILEEMNQKGNQVEVVWHYMEDDDDMLDMGKEFQEIINVPFTFIAIKPE
ncbi:MAG TPA: DUF1987 domain-containing protein [Bacteroidales bacterium]|nr:DUF1987 domain-containing protein [Bacteroidales bacterium]